MSDAPTPISPPPDSGQLRSVRLAAVVTLLILASPFAVLVLQESLAPVLAVILALVLAGPYIVLALRLLRPRQDVFRQAAGAGLAGLLLAGLLAALILILTFSFGEGWRKWEPWALLAGYSFLAWIQWVLYRNARRIQESLWPEPSQRRKWGGSTASHFVYYFALLLLVGMAVPSLLRNPKAANEATAVGALRTLQVAARAYQEQFENGYPASLATLLPPPAGTQASCTAADLIDSSLASGQKSGYRIEYRPGPPIEDPPAGCPPGVKSYIITARPLTYGKTGTYSFLTDETRVIRWTSDDRAATASDPPIS